MNLNERLLLSSTERSESHQCTALVRATTLLKQNVFTQSLNALLCSPCGFVSPKQLVVQSQCHLAGRRYGCLHRFIYQPHDCAPTVYKPQQVYSTSVSLLVEQCKQTEPKKPVSETPSWCWQRNLLELTGNQQLHMIRRGDDSPFRVCASEDGG